MTCAVEDPAKQMLADRDFTDAVCRCHPGIRPQSLQPADRHQIKFVVVEAHHLGFDGITRGGFDQAACPNRGLTADRFEGKPHHACQLASDDQRSRLLGAREIRVQPL